MARSKFIKQLGLALVFVMLFSMLSACGGGSSGDNTAATKQEATGEKTADTKAADANAPITFDVFLNHSWFWTDKFDGIIPAEITKATGVTLNPTRAADDKQLGIMIASGDLPELVYTETQIDRLSDPQYSLPWNELIAKAAPDYKPDPTSIMIAKSYSKDDNYYTILNAFSSEAEWKAAKMGCPSTPSLMLREDIMQKLGNPALKTIDDYFNVMKMVKEKYPDMIPLVMDQSYLFKVFKQMMIPGWCAGPNEFCRLDDGSIIYDTSSPKYLDFLKFANTCYKNGYITPDNFAFRDDSQSIQLASSGKAFSYSWYTGNTVEQLTQLTKQNGDPNAQWAAVKSLVESSKYYNAGAGWSGVFITKSCKDPERAMKFMQWMYSEKGQRLTQWGREGIDYKLDADGVPTFSEDWIQARNDDKVFYSKYNPAYYFGISGVTEAVGRASGVSQSSKDLGDEIRQRLVLAPEVTLSTPQADTDEKIILDKVVDLVKNEEIKTILSKNDDEFKKNYDAMLSKLNEIGIKKLEEFMTNKAKSFMAK